MWRVDFPVNTNNQTTRLYLRLLFWVAVALVISVATAHASERWATLEAIHQLENPRNSTSYGPCGELGAYQFLPQTWSMHSREPFMRALDRNASDAVAIKHYEWLRSSLERAGVPATPYTIGLAWNGGLDAAMSGRSPRAARDYAQRVANLATIFDRSTPAVAAAPSFAPRSAPPPWPFAVASVEPVAAPEPFMVMLPTSVPMPVVNSKSFVVALR